MVEITPDVLTKNALKAELEIYRKNGVKPDGGLSDKLFCLDGILDLGNINCGIAGEERKEFYRKNCALDSEFRHIDDIFRIYKSDAAEIMRYARLGETLRVWTCDMAFSMCSVYMLCDMLRNTECDIRIVEFPEDKRDKTSSWGYSHWGIMRPGNYYTYTQRSKLLTYEAKKHNIERWRKLKRENAALRVIRDGEVVSVSEDYHDEAIWKALPDSEFIITEAVGNMMKYMPVYINIGWASQRIDKWLADGRIVIVGERKGFPLMKKENRSF